jgi:hypothetical protein
MDERTDRPNHLSHAGDDLSCERFQDQLPRLLEAEEDVHLHPHLKTCARCSALLDELESIADWAKQLIKPNLEPPDELWRKIEKQMAEPEELREQEDSSKSHPLRPKPAG